MTEQNGANKPTIAEGKANTQDRVEIIGDRMLREVAAILAKPESNSTAQAV